MVEMKEENVSEQRKVDHTNFVQQSCCQVLPLLDDEVPLSNLLT